jgi:hypothetical protein
MKRLLLFLLPLACGCIGEQTRTAFTLRAPSSDVRIEVADHAAEHNANLQRALDDAIRAQEAQDDREWKDMERANAPAPVAALSAKSCAVHNLDTDTCDHL